VILISLILAALTFNPAIAPRPSSVTEGYLTARPMSSDFSCAPGAICASTKHYRNGCYYNNFWVKGVQGGTPLAIDVTQTGPQGSVVYVYWVNNTNKTIKLTSVASLKYYCP
jgi:hypothetical protein